MDNVKVGLLKYILTSVTILVGLFLLSQVLIAYAPADDKDGMRQGVPDAYSIFAVKLPRQPILAGDRIPIEYFDVRETLDREFLSNMYWQSNMLLLIKRANRFFPIVEPILKEYGVPDDMKYVMVIESGMMNVSSPAGAKGFWQIMKPTAGDYGLEINSEVDERYNLEKSTVAAAKFLNWSYAKFQNWSLVAASYNMGRGGVLGQLKKQGVTDYWELLLNNETARYVSRIIAVKYIMESPEAYGFRLEKEDMYPVWPCKEVDIVETIPNIAEWAQANGTTYKMVKMLNPWLMGNSLTVQKNEYKIKLLKEGFRKPLGVNKALLDSL